MSKIRQSAKHQPCQIRLAGVCNSNRETTVLAHFRLSETCGVALKPPDYLGAWACSACHDAVDGRVKTDYTHDELRLAHAEGIFRTWGKLVAQNLITMRE